MLHVIVRIRVLLVLARSRVLLLLHQHGVVAAGTAFRSVSHLLGVGKNDEA